MAVELFIQHNSTIQFPVVKEGARLTLERKGTPGKLEFTVVKGPGLNFAEGDPVKLTVNGTAMFYGFVFKKKRDKGGTIDVVAYDQLRYLKNKDTITEEGLKASDLLKRIATDFRLNLGTVEDTGYTLETIVEENQTLPSRTFRMNHNNLTIIGTIDEIQAVEQAVFLILNTERYEWLIHSWDYGVELHNLIGKDVEYCIPEIERRVREALLQDDRITAVQNFEFTVNKKKVLTTFTVVSIFGEINAELGVEI